jgi:hypothetical protein
MQTNVTTIALVYSVSSACLVSRSTHHIDYFRIDLLCDDAPLRSNILEHFVQSLSFHLLALHISTRIIEVKDDRTLVEFLDEELVAFLRRYL